METDLVVVDATSSLVSLGMVVAVASCGRTLSAIPVSPTFIVVEDDGFGDDNEDDEDIRSKHWLLEQYRLSKTRREACTGTSTSQCL